MTKYFVEHIRKSNKVLQQSKFYYRDKKIYYSIKIIKSLLQIQEIQLVI